MCSNNLAESLDFPCMELQRGYERDGIIINRSDIETITYGGGGPNNNHVSAITLKQGQYGQPVLQPYNLPYNGTQKQLNVGTYANTWNKSVTILIPTKGGHSSFTIDALVGGEFVLILRNKQKKDASAVGQSDFAEDDTEYEMFGVEQGLKVAEGSETAYDEETMGGTLITLTETGASRHGLFLYAGTGKTATDTLYQSLLRS